MLTPNVRLVRQLGEGGMGAVWLADHLALRAQVAVKFLSGSFANEPTALARFNAEATLVAQIRSPHVVQVHDTGESEGTPYIVMELLEGEDLGARLARDGTLRVEDAAVVMAHVCKALSKAHEHGIVHRDIKPGNLFLVPSDGDIFVKILDFGVAKRADEARPDLTGTGNLVGTPYYMSPEQVLDSKSATASADLWATTVVMYQALTGRLPFTGEGIGAICVAVERAAFTPPSTHSEALSPAIDAWFARAFAREADERFPTARDLNAAFQAAVRGEMPAPAPPAARRSLSSDVPTWGSHAPSDVPTIAVPVAVAAPAVATHVGSTMSSPRGGSRRVAVAVAAAAVALVGGLAVASMFQKNLPHIATPVAASGPATPATLPQAAAEAPPPTGSESPVVAVSTASAVEVSPAVSVGAKPRRDVAPSAPAPARSAATSPSTPRRRDHGF